MEPDGVCRTGANFIHQPRSPTPMGRGCLRPPRSAKHYLQQSSDYTAEEGHHMRCFRFNRHDEVLNCDHGNSKENKTRFVAT
ncbi:hypothetical protein RHMOL_Rhmol11G0081000 [Rhododendron molle]|uniref:Uncharacterized protein n=1 Tax=Rhododendron molle TaxID=49168 RepID=A0ACC0LQ01_RHOML|nr:hypothetical protein RHMOL_Rhmol11G0081000 [Rhododendron molle]